MCCFWKSSLGQYFVHMFLSGLLVGYLACLLTVSTRLSRTPLTTNYMYICLVSLAHSHKKVNEFNVWLAFSFAGGVLFVTSFALFVHRMFSFLSETLYWQHVRSMLLSANWCLSFELCFTAEARSFHSVCVSLNIVFAFSLWFTN